MVHRSEVIPGRAIGVDPAAKAVVIKKITDEELVREYDYLVLAPGSVTRTFDIPGLAEYGRGMKTLAEAAYIRDHVIAQLDLASATTDQAERESRLQFVVVGGGYAGTETAAVLQRLTTAAAKRYPRLDPALIKWHLIDIAPRLMPELGEKLGLKALQIVRERGVEVSLGVSVAEVTPDTVTFTDGRKLPCRTLIWTAGVASSPLVTTLGTETVKGRLVTDPEMCIPGADGVFALGDSAAVPDLDVGGGAVCPPTAQHAMRQGKAVAENVVAALRGRPFSRTGTRTSDSSSTSAGSRRSPSRSASRSAASPPRSSPAATTSARCGPSPRASAPPRAGSSTPSPGTTSCAPASRPAGRPR